jgi:ribosomal protein S18 acetylase RimI-like enzyme
MNHAAISLRPALARDSHAIALMSREHIEHGLPWKYDAARIQRSLARSDVQLPAACDRGALVGFALMEFGDERAHLVLMAVRPTHRRRGIGRRLLEWLIESALAAGIESVHLELRATNDGARRFYRMLGFGETILVPRYYEGRESAMRMVRVLRPPMPSRLSWQPPQHWR